MSNVSVTFESAQERAEERHKAAMAFIADTAKELHAEHLRVMESLSSTQQHHCDALRAALQHDSDRLSDKLERHGNEFSARLQHDGDDLRDKLQQQSVEFSARLQHDGDDLRDKLQQQGVEFSARLQHDGDDLRDKLQRQSAEFSARLEHDGDVLRASLKQVVDTQQSAWEALQREIHRLDSKIERMNRWVIGLFLTYLVATATLFARPYLNI
jgi:hypothetical protein